MYRILTAVLALTLAACQPSGQDEPVPEANETPIRDSPTSPPTESVANAGIDLPTLLDRSYQRDEAGHLSVLDRLNEPTSIEVDTVQNIHNPNQIDTLRTLRYDGLELTFYNVAGGKAILKSISVTGEQYATDDGLKVGLSRNALEQVWGTPEERREGTYVYELDGPMPPHVEVSLQGDTVRSVQWNYPID